MPGHWGTFYDAIYLELATLNRRSAGGFMWPAAIPHCVAPLAAAAWAQHGPAGTGRTM